MAAALRSILRPASRSLSSIRTLTTSPPSITSSFTSSYHSSGFSELHRNHSWRFPPPSTAGFHSLTDTRFPKRRPSLKPKRKRASLKPPGPYAWVKYVPGEPILPNQPNEGSVKRRNEKKRIKLQRAFILSEKRKRTAQLQEAKRKKEIKRRERKMAAVQRERAWAERLIELQQLEEEKKAAMA